MGDGWWWWGLGVVVVVCSHDRVSLMFNATAQVVVKCLARPAVGVCMRRLQWVVAKTHTHNAGHWCIGAFCQSLLVTVLAWFFRKWHNTFCCLDAKFDTGLSDPTRHRGSEPTLFGLWRNLDSCAFPCCALHKVGEHGGKLDQKKISADQYHGPFVEDFWWSPVDRVWAHEVPTLLFGRPVDWAYQSVPNKCTWTSVA